MTPTDETGAEPRRVGASRFAKDALGAVVQAGARWSDDSCYRLGASLAYCALFSIFPLLLLCVTVFGFVLGDGDSVRQSVLRSVSGGSSAEVKALLDQTLQSMQTHRTARGIGAVVGALALFVGASGVFSELEASLNTIWRVEAKPSSSVWASVVTGLRAKAFSFAVVLLAAAALFASLVLSAAIGALGQAAQGIAGSAALFSWLEHGISAALLTLLLAAVYRYVPQTPVAWRDVFGAAFLTALLFTALKGLLAFYLARLAGYTAYGAVGAVLGMLTWIYIASLVLFYGAELSWVYAHRFGSHAQHPG